MSFPDNPTYKSISPSQQILSQIVLGQKIFKILCKHLFRNTYNFDSIVLVDFQHLQLYKRTLIQNISFKNSDIAGCAMLTCLLVNLSVKTK